MTPKDPTGELLLVEDTLWVVAHPTSVPIYDFNFRDWFRCRSPYELPGHVQAVAHIGAVSNYENYFQECGKQGIELVNSVEQHFRASRLENWYPLLTGLTPKSVCFGRQPRLEQVKAHFAWPVFMKGSRQTSRHQRKLSIIENDAAFLDALAGYARDPVLAWQDVVCREFVPLRALSEPAEDPNKLPRSFEFRTFWWKGRLVGAGRYWWEGAAYDWTESERRAGLAVAEEAARRVGVPFMVVDIAQTRDGRWIVIECNDAQESGYAGVLPIGLWQQILDCEKARQ